LTYKIEKNTIVVRDKRHDQAENTVEKASVHQQPVSGSVTDSVNAPIEGVSVMVNGQQRGTTTGKDGRFVIEAQQGDVLGFSIIGYESEGLAVGEGDIRVVLAMSSSNLEEVVVVAYGVPRTRDLTGLFIRIQGEYIKNM